MKETKAKGTRIGLSCVMLLAFAARGQAGAIAITNPGFESPAQVQGGILNGVATGWNVSNGLAGVWNPSPVGSYFNTAPPEGNQILFVGFGAAADVDQTLAATVLANTTYTLTYSLGQRLDMPLSAYSVSLEANGTTVLATDSSGTTTAGNFVTRTIQFNSGPNPATLGQTLGIFIHASGLSGASAAQAEFDNFSLNTPSGPTGAPEPATFVLMGAGVGAILALRRRWQKQS